MIPDIGTCHDEIQSCFGKNGKSVVAELSTLHAARKRKDMLACELGLVRQQLDRNPNNLKLQAKEHDCHVAYLRSEIDVLKLALSSQADKSGKPICGCCGELLEGPWRK